MPKGPDVFTAIKAWLDAEEIAYELVQHAPTRTSQEAVAVRGEDLNIGGKAVVMKVDDTFRLFVLSAALKLDSKTVKREFFAQKLRFATEDELAELTGLEPGAVPPFGEPILPLELIVDYSILENDRIAFNAGSLTDSVIMSVDDYLRLADPSILVFSKAAE
jgi:prolyl-tRNA editing enzyme YbaK/EbsC (Cys-tRNA(Pro) deacylase)